MVNKITKKVTEGDAEEKAAAIDILGEMSNTNSVSLMIVKAHAVDATPVTGDSPDMVDTLFAVRGVKLGRKIG